MFNPLVVSSGVPGSLCRKLTFRLRTTYDASDPPAVTFLRSFDSDLIAKTRLPHPAHSCDT